MAVKEQRPAVKRMKKGSSFFGYTDTSWNAAVTIRDKQPVRKGSKTKPELKSSLNNERMIMQSKR